MSTLMTGNSRQQWMSIDNMSTISKRSVLPALGVHMIHQSSIRFYTTPTQQTESAPATIDSSVATAPITSPDVTANVADVVSNAPTSEAITAAAAQIGDFKAMGLCNYTPVGALEAALEAIHVSTGLPWWAAIAAATVAIRICMIPLNIKVQRNNARVSNINPDLQRIMNNVSEAKKAGDQVAIAKYSQQAQQLFKDNGCHPAKSLLLPVVQAPVMISFFMALRAMAELPVPGFLDGGLAWFTDLSVKDPYYILPILSSAGMLAILETGSETGAANPQAAGMKNFFRGMTVLMIPFTAWMPSVSLPFIGFSLRWMEIFDSQKKIFFFHCSPFSYTGSPTTCSVWVSFWRSRHHLSEVHLIFHSSLSLQPSCRRTARVLYKLSRNRQLHIKRLKKSELFANDSKLLLWPDVPTSVAFR